MEQKLDQRIIIPMTRDMVRAIGDFRHAAKVSTRSEAVRELIRLGLDKSQPLMGDTMGGHKAK